MKMKRIARRFRKQLAFSAIAFALLAMPGAIFGHHGNAAYDLTKPITLKATVTEFVWANPHVQLYFDVKNGNGNIVHWASETVSPGLLSRAGWSKNQLKPGDQITITVGPSKNGAPVGYALKIVLSNGKELILGQGRDTTYTP